MDSPAGRRAFARATPTRDDLATAVSAFQASPAALPLECGVQHYGWGDPNFIPALIDAPNPRGLPFAELWIGAHPDLLATVQLGGWRLSLAELIAAAPITMLGSSISQRFGNSLPFLLKVLAARHPLSIQVHPTKAQAVAGFEREQAMGLPLNEARRSYRDRNHKPELLVAITDFYALRGFRPLNEIADELAAAPELAALRQGFEPTKASLFALYRRLMQCDQAEVNDLLSPLIDRYLAERQGHSFDPSDRRDWIIEADRRFSAPARRDRGLFSLLLLNLLVLHPGDAIFLPAGELHAYLRGAAIEVMANSNNVLRGGLTEKHIDVPALLATLNVDPAPAQVLRPVAAKHPGEPETYPTPAAEFLLERHSLRAGEQRRIPGERPSLRVGLVLDGQVTLEAPGHPPLGLTHGAAFAIPAACAASFHAQQRSVVYTVRAP
jgi:mannose-6-phosphate isomerase class I